MPCFHRFWCICPALILALGATAELAAPFESLGIPVRKAGLMGTIVGPGPTEGSERIYINMRQDGGKLFLVSIDPETGATEQFQSPVGTGAWGFMTGPDGRIYLGTHEGPDANDSGMLLVFDPKQPEKQIQAIGKPSDTESYLWMFCTGADQKIYGCTFPGAKIVSYDPATGAMADHGVMDETQQYSRNICTGPDGMIYVGIGYGRANVVRFDPKTGAHESILPEQYRADPKQTTASVWRGVDGAVYVSAISMTAGADGQPEAGSATLRVEKAGLVEVANAPAAVTHTTLRDGRHVSNVTIDGAYDLVSPDGAVEKRTFTYASAGCGLFMVDNGPLGRIYGGTFMPNELFHYDPATGALENPGNPTEVGGEIYSMLDHNGLLYVCAYPGSFLSRWDPKLPWNYGREATNNPRGFGNLGPGHLRPRAMIHGPGQQIYIGSFPEYGMLGGSLGVWDPVEDRLIENYPQLIRNQSITTLVWDEKTGLIFGGSSTQGGGGSTPSEPSAKFFAFDSTAKQLKFEIVVADDVPYIRAMCPVGRKIYGVGKGDTLFVYDIDAEKLVHQADLGVGSVCDVSLRPWKDGMIYGVASRKIFKLDPESYACTTLAEYPNTIRCGFAIDDHGIYFGDRAELIRYNWPAH
ncbi:MAG: PQQ-like beta-propeller repeat protein [Candidatus Hydrogenedentes bacterium]|nr:PQQ-like beta-propeller repeat protein [Candidatus Hydrogenedentota bacterium]